MLLATLIATVFVAADPAAALPAPGGAPVPLLHISDLYHPHNDPDDHWDLATAFALAKAGHVQLLGVLLDYPLTPRPDPSAPGDPALQAVAQMNHLAGLAVPCAVGASTAYSAVASGEAELTRPDRNGIAFILDTLRDAPSPVAISVVGSCRDLALAGREAPDLFREKCRGIYLNAGTGSTDPAKGANQEWNVLLDPAAYRSIFEIPCPIYWLPCFEDMTWTRGGDMTVQRYGSFWRFTQGEVLPKLSPGAQNYFLYALTRSADLRWLQYLLGPVDQHALEQLGAQQRNMWCTAGYLHLAGLAVTKAGRIVPLAGLPREDALFAFQPITVQLNEAGVADWTIAGSDARQFIFEVKDTEAYEAQMTSALGTLLSVL